jgi:hypothetical protein
MGSTVSLAPKVVMAVFIAPMQAAELRMFGSCRHRCSEPIFLDAEVLCRTRASVSVLVIVPAPVGETRANK